MGGVVGWSTCMCGEGLRLLGVQVVMRDSAELRRSGSVNRTPHGHSSTFEVAKAGTACLQYI